MRSTDPADHVPRTVSKLLKLYDCECTVFNRPPCNRRQPSLMQSLRILVQKSARLFAPIHDNQSVRTWDRALVPVLFRTRPHLTMVQRLPLPRAKAPDTRIKRHEVSLLLILISQFHLSSLIGEMSRQRKKHQCSVCPKSFTTSANLKHHQAVHRGEKPNRCKSCFKGFTRPVDLSRHRNEVHLDVRKVVCPGCDKGFGRSSLLLRHLRGTTAEPCRRSTINDTSVDVAASTGLDMPGGYPFLPVAHVASAAEVIESQRSQLSSLFFEA